MKTTINQSINPPPWPMGAHKSFRLTENKQRNLDGCYWVKEARRFKEHKKRGAKKQCCYEPYLLSWVQVARPISHAHTYTTRAHGQQQQVAAEFVVQCLRYTPPAEVSPAASSTTHGRNVSWVAVYICSLFAVDTRRVHATKPATRNGRGMVY